MLLKYAVVEARTIFCMEKYISGYYKNSQNTIEIFRPDVAGKDVIEALLKIVNKVKEQQTFPKKMKYADITSVYKGRGSKTDMDNQRGLFNLVTIRTIVDKLIYLDEYKTIDDNLTDCNVGARKKRNIRDNLFVVNGVINSVIKKNDKPIDVGLFDIIKCFDTLWLKECLNDLYEAGLQNSNLNLLYEGNKECFMSVKTPGGKTERVKMDEIVMQGSVWGPLLCTGTMDKIGKKAYKTGATLYKYKGLVSVPPLGMVDDELTMAECGAQSTLTNAMINNFTESKKLKLRIKKYIGDVISADGYNTANIKERCDKGYGIAN